MILAAKAANSGKCPCWGVEIAVIGLYTKGENGDWRFIRQECPIIQNSQLPVYDQDTRYKYMKCAKPSDCPLYTQFQPSITSDK